MIENRTALPSSNYFNFTLLLDDIMGPAPVLPARCPSPSDFKINAFSDASTDAGSESSNRGSLISSPEKCGENDLVRGGLGRDRLVNEFQCDEVETAEPVKTRFSLSECFKVSESVKTLRPRLRVSVSGLGAGRPRVFKGAQLKGCLKGRHFQRLARKLKRVFEKGRLVSC